MPAIGKRIISYSGSSGDDYGGILWLPDAIKRFRTDNDWLNVMDLFGDAEPEPVPVVLGCRASSPGEIAKGSLGRQQEDCLARIRAFGGRVVAVVGMDRPRAGKLSTRRRDLMEGASLAKQHHAILCYRDLARVFHPAAYHQRTNPDATYLPEDFARLRQFTGDGPLAVIEPPHLPLKELLSRAQKCGTKQSMAEGKFPGRPHEIDERYMQLIISDRGAGLSIRKIAEGRGVTESMVQRLLDLCKRI